MARLQSLATFALAGVLIQSAGQVNASVFETAKIQRIIDGKEVYIDRREAKTNQTATKGQQVSTGSSRSELLFDRTAIGFLGRNSLITLGQSCFRLKQGSVLINGNQRSCLGSKVLGVRGTTYVLSVNPDGNYDLAVLHGQASVGDSSSTAAATTKDILETYPRLNPVVSLGSSAWGSNTNGLNLGEAAGLVLGDVGLYVPISQVPGQVLYSYSTGSSNFDGYWGGSSELGYSWFNPNNQSTNTVVFGYDGWKQPSCSHSQLSAGAMWQRQGLQLGVNGGVPVDNCESQLGFAMAQFGVPLLPIGEQALQLTLAPYLLHGLGENYGGGRASLGIPLSPTVQLMGYGQYDELLDTVVGGQLRLSFGLGGGMVNDPNLQTPQQRSPLPMAKRQFNNGQPWQIALGESQPTATGEDKLISQETGTVFEAGEKATLSPQGVVINRGQLTASEYKALVMANLSGQNLLPEGNAIHSTYQNLYGLNSPALMAVTGANWLIAARTPYPRLRGANNLEVPDNKLPQKDNKKNVIVSETTTEVKYVCKSTDASNLGFGTYYSTSSQIGTDSIGSATQYSFTRGITSASCSYFYTSGSQTANYNIPVEVSSSSTTTQRAETINNTPVNRVITNNPNQRIITAR